MNNVFQIITTNPTKVVKLETTIEVAAGVATISCGDKNAKVKAQVRGETIFINLWDLTNAMRKSTMMGPTDTIATAGSLFLTNGASTHYVAEGTEHKDEELQVITDSTNDDDVLE